LAQLCAPLTPAATSGASACSWAPSCSGSAGSSSATSSSWPTEKATDTAARVASSVAIDSIAARPIVIPELTVAREPGGVIRIDETVQVREDCEGERLERRGRLADGRSEQVVPMEGADSWQGGSFTSELPPGVHHVWVRYHWPEEALPLLYFIRADFREAKCKSGFNGEYLVLYREMDPG
jgi:hypothetical protein